MITKALLAASMVHECNVSIHLAEKLSAAAKGYRPTPGQRTTEELLGYLSFCGIAGTRSMAEGNWKIFGDYRERAKELAIGAFPAAMIRQREELTAFFDQADDALMSKETGVPGGGRMPLDAAILNGPLKWLTGYKMQLFLYAKATGTANLGTTNAWAGFDMKT
jgi:hypothetical protein